MSPADELVVVIIGLPDATFRVYKIASDNFIAGIIEMLYGKQESGVEWAWTAFEVE